MLSRVEFADIAAVCAVKRSQNLYPRDISVVCAAKFAWIGLLQAFLRFLSVWNTAKRVLREKRAVLVVQSAVKSDRGRNGMSQTPPAIV